MEHVEMLQLRQSSKSLSLLEMKQAKWWHYDSISKKASNLPSWSLSNPLIVPRSYSMNLYMMVSMSKWSIPIEHRHRYGKRMCFIFATCTYMQSAWQYHQSIPFGQYLGIDCNWTYGTWSWFQRRQSCHQLRHSTDCSKLYSSNR